ncbi:MAG TPA: fimbria/pilus outer membrane usher protein [Allosphingosinicella sp.]
MTAAAAASGEMTEMVLELRINGAAAGPAVVVERDAAGTFYLPAATLETLSLEAKRFETVILDGRTWIRLGPGGEIRTSYDAAAQRLDLVLPPSAFRAERITVTGPTALPMTSAAGGFFLNYDLEADAGNGAPAAATGAFEAGLFSGALLAEGTAIGRVSGSGAHVVRLDTRLTWDDPDHMLSLRVGDTISRGGTGGAPLRIGGLQFTRSFEVEPGFLTGAVPTLAGSAALPSVADLYVNGTLTATKEVRPGAFTLTGFPVVTGSGTVEMVVRDALGRETVVRQAYYAAPGLLRAGLSDFSYEIGFLRRDYAVASASYGRLAASATHRFGVTDRLTLEAHAAATAETQQAAASADLALPELGLLSVSAAASRDRGGVTGESWGIAFEHRSRGFSFGGSAKLASEGYRQVDDDRPLPALDLRASAGLSERWGAINVSYLRRDYRDGRADSEVVGGAPLSGSALWALSAWRPARGCAARGTRPSNCPSRPGLGRTPAPAPRAASATATASPRYCSSKTHRPPEVGAIARWRPPDRWAAWPVRSSSTRRSANTRPSSPIATAGLVPASARAAASEWPGGRFSRRNASPMPLPSSTPASRAFGSTPTTTSSAAPAAMALQSSRGCEATRRTASGSRSATCLST